MLLCNIPLYSPTIREDKGLHFRKSKVEAPLFVGKSEMIKYHLSRRRFGSRQNLQTTALHVNGHVSVRDVKSDIGSDKGLGIEKYFDSKNLLITGVTGLLGKALVEKLLRSTEVGKIYVLIKAEDRDAAMDRLEKEVINLDLYDCLRKKHGKYYREFMKEKVIPIIGNICGPNLGMDSHSATTIMEEVNVIVSSAAITTLNERYDLLLNTNVNGTQQLMRFARTCKNLDLFVQISTAYVNGTSDEGIILEKELVMGENPRNQNEETSQSLSSCRPRPRPHPRFDIADEINLALKSSTATTNYDMTRYMKRLGMERSALYSWSNTYHFTKAMAEMVVSEGRGDLPVVIVRPSVIESCYKEPLPGWLQGTRMFDPVIISYGKGQLPAFFGQPDAPMDVIPLDMVVNATIAAIAKHGQIKKAELNVYQVATSVANPLTYSDFFDYLYDYFSSDPLIESETFTRINYYNDITKIRYFDDFNEFSKYTREEISRRMEMRNAVYQGEKRNQKQEKQCKAQFTYAEQLCRIYEVVGFIKARFDGGNTQKLLSEMSKEEKINFGMDVSEIDWRKYFQQVHIPGLRKHVLNDDKRQSVI